MLNLRGVYLSSNHVHYDSSGGVLPPSQSDFSTTFSAIHFSSAIVGNMGAPLHTSSSHGSHTLYSPSQASYPYSVRDARSDDGLKTGWEMEDEGVETSSDPLVVGLLVGGETVELSSISAKEV